MNKRWIPLFLLLTVTGCGIFPSSAPTTTTIETTAQSRMQSRLDKLLEACLSAAQAEATPQAAESAMLAIYTRWKQTEAGDTQFQAQAQRLANGGMQLQVQAQLSDGNLSLQAQRQLIIRPRT